MDFALRQSFLLNGLKNFLSAAAQLSQIKFPLFGVQFAIAAFLNPVWEIFGNLSFQSAKHEWAQFGREPPAPDFLRPDIVIPFRFVVFLKGVGGSEVCGLDEIDDAPQIEKAFP